jgi:halocyanin-like protein
MTDSDSVTRRHVLRLGTLVGVASLAGCGGSGGGTATPAGTPAGDDGQTGGGSDDSSGEPAYDGWLDDVSNYDGTPADRTGSDTVTVAVGAGNGLRFEPAAVRVSPGTTVVWEWTGEGGQHNVQAEDGAYESELATAEGTTFEHTFEESGVSRYLCLPHRAVGMKGVVKVVDG